jgi:hypothetical protein
VTKLARREVHRAEIVPRNDDKRTRLQAITPCAVCGWPVDGEAAEQGDDIHDGACWAIFKREIAGDWTDL